VRILLINPNTSYELTERVAQLSRAAVGGAAEIVAVTGRFGARYISSRAAAAIAGHAALDAFAMHGEGCDAVYLACFGDPGLLALRELSRAPVVGMAEAACREAAVGGRRFSIVTGGRQWPPMLEELMDVLGLSPSLASVRAVAPTGRDIARDPDASLAVLADACRRCATEDGAQTVVLGGAGLGGLAARLGSSVPVPLVCSVEAGIRDALRAARECPATSVEPPDPVETSGLEPALARLLER
jgi:allantoin racemase